MCMSRKQLAAFLIMFVDDIHVTRNYLEMIKATKKWLSFVSQAKYIVEARDVQRMEIVRNHSTKALGTFQEACIKIAFEGFPMHNSELVNTPTDNCQT